MTPPPNYLPGWLALFEAGCTFVACASAVYVAQRDARWRKNGLAKQLENRIDAAQLAADRWHETPPAERIRADLDRHALTLQDHANAIKHSASRADVARVEGSVKELGQVVGDAKAGIDRIENILIRQALDNRAHT
ncbi:MAG TPA: hypothetical protein VMU59_14320 [Caulobacteraceae bacterium]|nr:hypothetical protein [Caulobacteraceae bacterium]